MDPMTQNCKLTLLDQNTLQLQGTVNCNTAGRLFWLMKQKLVRDINRIDCHEIKEADSAALGLLLACRRLAVERNLKLKIEGLGEQLLSLARLYDVEQLLTE